MSGICTERFAESTYLDFAAKESNDSFKIELIRESSICITFDVAKTTTKFVLLLLQSGGAFEELSPSKRFVHAGLFVDPSWILAACHLVETHN